MHSVLCGLLRHMLHVAWSVRASVCVLGTRVSCAKTDEPIEMPFGSEGNMYYMGVKIEVFRSREG